MNKLITIFATALLAAVSFGQMSPMKQRVAKKEIACAVMPSNKVDMVKAVKTKMFADYKGNRYFFCCAGCPEAFKKSPAKYANAPHIKTPKKSS